MHMGKSCKERQEIVGWSAFNNAFSVATGYDATDLCSTSHTDLDGTVQSNRPSPDVTISQTAIQAGLLNYDLLNDDRSLAMKINPSRLIYHSTNRWLVREILGSSGKVQTADNDGNALLPDDLMGVAEPLPDPHSGLVPMRTEGSDRHQVHVARPTHPAQLRRSLHDGCGLHTLYETRCARGRLAPGVRVKYGGVVANLLLVYSGGMESKEQRQKRNRENWQRIKNDPELLAKEREKSRLRYAEHIEEEHIRSRAYYERNIGKVSARTSQYFKEHREWDNARKRSAYANDPKKFRQQQMLWKYKEWLLPEQLYAIWEQLQDGPCDLCGKTGERMRIDHCHARKMFRGVLCHSCNVSLGHFNDDPATFGRLRPIWSD